MLNAANFWFRTLDEYGVGFRVMHGYGSATAVYNVARYADDEARKLVILYVGDYDPSGMNMSEHDLPTRFKKYEGKNVRVRRIALTRKQTSGLPSFPASDKRKDKRYPWFVRNYGHECWELDAMDPNELRDCVEREIKKLIEPTAWNRCIAVNAAEKESLRSILEGWQAL